MDQDDHKSISDKLTQARLTGAPIAQFGDSFKSFSEADAYTIQELGIQERLARGERLIGIKMGLTSEAKRKQMDLHSPLYGELTDVMEVAVGGAYSLAGTIHPKIEPEIAFKIGRELSGEVTREEVLEACVGVCAAMEILDSRYEHFKYFSLEEVIADNSSSSHFVLGPWVSDVKRLDLINLKLAMSVNGEVAHEGVSSAISGDPVVSVIQLCELLARRGRVCPAGSIILAGAATAAVALEAGQRVELMVEGLPSVELLITA
jgi:2-oxo-3-hexenedioate decarboxylase